MKKQGIRSNSVLWATGLVHGWFVAISSGSSPTPIDQVLIVFDRQQMPPHARRVACVLPLAVAAAAGLIAGKEFDD